MSGVTELTVGRDKHGEEKSAAVQKTPRRDGILRPCDQRAGIGGAGGSQIGPSESKQMETCLCHIRTPSPGHAVSEPSSGGLGL